MLEYRLVYLYAITQAYAPKQSLEEHALTFSK
jgi:hypothetical protein